MVRYAGRRVRRVVWGIRRVMSEIRSASEGFFGDYQYRRYQPIDYMKEYIKLTLEIPVAI